MDKTIKYKGKSATEVIIAIDCSSSTRYTELENGKTYLFVVEADSLETIVKMKEKIISTLSI